jgi:hypothetical protein
MQALVIVAFVVVAVAVIVVRFVLKQRRRDELGQFALANGLEYSPSDPFGLVDPSFRLFQQGDGRGCENVVWGPWHGLTITEADYWYYTESTDSNGSRTKTYHYFSVALADLDALVPYVRVEKENLLSVVTSHLGFHDIEFESEQFNRMFKVKSEDREFAFKLIDDRMMQWLLSTEGRFGFEVRGGRFLVYSRKLPPTGLIPIFGTAAAFRDHIPRLVWNEYGSGQPAGAQSAAAGQPAPAIPPVQKAAPPAASPPVPASPPGPPGPPGFVNDVMPPAAPAQPPGGASSS